MKYREFVLKTFNAELMRDPFKALVYAAMGLCGESGEVIELVKKSEFHGHSLDREKLIKELGDVRWYLELIAVLLTTTMENVEKANIDKISKSYPNGFTTNDSINRPQE